jgi:hypothetical protein
MDGRHNDPKHEKIARHPIMKTYFKQNYHLVAVSKIMKKNTSFYLLYSITHLIVVAI